VYDCVFMCVADGSTGDTATLVIQESAVSRSPSHGHDSGTQTDMIRVHTHTA